MPVENAESYRTKSSRDSEAYKGDDVLERLGPTEVGLAKSCPPILRVLIDCNWCFCRYQFCKRSGDQILISPLSSPSLHQLENVHAVDGCTRRCHAKVPSRSVEKIRALGGKNIATDLPPSGGHYLLVLLTAVYDHTMFGSMDEMRHVKGYKSDLALLWIVRMTLPYLFFDTR